VRLCLSTIVEGVRKVFHCSIYFWASALCLSCFSSCERAVKKEFSQIEIVIPRQDSQNQKASAQSAIDYNKLCFAVNVRGQGIPAIQNNCDVAAGLRTGAVQPGGVLTVDAVPVGESLTFELYGLLRNSTSEPCPSVTAQQWNFPLNKIFLVGHISNYKISKEDETLTIDVSLPASSAHLAAAFSLPASCLPTTPELSPKHRVVVSTLVGATANLKFDTRISFKPQGQNLTGTNLQIKNWSAGGSP
jgi:hypothetical protein